MTDTVRVLAGLKCELTRTCRKKGILYEPIPTEPSGLGMELEHLRLLHRFASENPIYYNSYAEEVCGISCTVYEGDINRFWLGSIGHDRSRAPFSPTWMCSAYMAARTAKELGADRIVDVGSGDGRIAYCARVLGLGARSVEIDGALADLQKSLVDTTGIDWSPVCADAASLDYESGTGRTAFFIGGLAQMGGDALARAVIERIRCDQSQDPLMVLVGTYSKKYPDDGTSMGGWGHLIGSHMKLLRTLVLPTAWTFAESEDAPYLFAELRRPESKLRHDI